jgi:UDP-N-acetylmuramoyl-tripeptide--D-alanyl-D-alanine ligase
VGIFCLYNMTSLLNRFLDHPSITIDTRTIVPGQIYFAIKGEHFDGNQFVMQAIEKGASICVSSDKTFLGVENVVVVDDTLKALQKLASEYRLTFDIPVLAITGSNGKTTTKELLATVLQTKYKTHYTLGNLNNHLGVPLTLLATPQDAQFIIVEMGANHQGEIHDLCKIALPDYGAITNIGIAHIEGFGSPEGVKIAKSELFYHVNTYGKKFFLNTTEQSLLFLQDPNNKRIKELDYGGTFIEPQDSDNGFLTINYRKKRVVTNLVGDYNMPNLVLALGVGEYFGCDPDLMIDAIQSYQPTNNRSQLMEIDEVEIIMDAYNANPSSMSHAVDNIINLKQVDRGVILGDMLELGENSMMYHRLILQKIRDAKGVISMVILVGPQFYSLKVDFPEFIYYKNTDEAKVGLHWSQYSGYKVLIKGSRGLQLEKLIN